MISINKEMTVAEIVTENIKTADVFKRNGIDFCCGGKISLRSACEKKGLDYESIFSEIEAINSGTKREHDYDSWDLDFLSDYIINTHHNYVTEANSLIIQYSDRVAHVHGKHYPEVVRVNQLFHSIVNELKSHMHKEEMILFPFIKQLVIANRNGDKISPPPFGTIQNPINMMESEHDGAGDVIKEIATLTNNYTPPQDACNTFKALYSSLEEYQNDLFQHIHLENNILFPKAIRLENKLSQ